MFNLPIENKGLFSCRVYIALNEVLVFSSPNPNFNAKCSICFSYDQMQIFVSSVLDF